MPVLVYLDHSDGQIKKSSLEAACYASSLAGILGSHAEAIIIGALNTDLSALGVYGLKKVHHASGDALNTMDSRIYARIISDLAIQLSADCIVFSNNVNGKSIAPRLSVRLKAGLAAGVLGLPDTSNGFTFKRSVFSGKAYMSVNIATEVKIIAVTPNSYPVQTQEGKAEVLSIDTTGLVPAIKITSTEKVQGTVPLGEAERVVSGGRGLKGPENWGIIEEMAQLIGAATACSRPVADAHWRPHHEHVGQTGGSIAPTLYFAVGISGAIQHLAGVNRSKVIVVINKDPEAPFFKAADYGIVGDAFEVMPRLIAAVKQLKSS
jgi:electron transfer flavoprotein alpha subunit